MKSWRKPDKQLKNGERKRERPTSICIGLREHKSSSGSCLGGHSCRIRRCLHVWLNFRLLLPSCGLLR